ncbi:Coq4 family protein [Trichocoleus sp. Lan]|uniref:Coq4 family protein n=1 Tax=Trichocoleus sp. Lan TaxID=2933927 RepID=UPI00329A4155
MSKSPSIINADMSRSVTPELLKGLEGFLAFIDNGTDIEAVFDIAAALANHKVSAAAITYLKSHPEIAQLFEEQYIAPTPNLEALLKLPEDSLGFAYASHMRAANLDPEFYRQVELQDDTSYLALRMRQTHDIWHTVTGFGTDPVGEIGLQAFTLAQNRSPLAVMLIAAITLNTIKMNSDLNPLVSLIQQSYDLGDRAKPFLGQKWEEAWEKPLVDWRAELNVTPFRHV